MIKREIFSEIRESGDPFEAGLAEFEDLGGARVMIPVASCQGELVHTCITFERVVRGAIPGPVLRLPSGTLFFQTPEGLPWEQKPGKNAEFTNMRLVELISQ